MTYIKMSADYVSIDELSRLTSIPHQLIDQFVNRGMQFAYTIVDGFDSKLSFDEKKLSFLFYIDELGLGSKVKQTMLKLYEKAAVNSKISLNEVDRFLRSNKVDEVIVNEIVDRMIADFE